MSTENKNKPVHTTRFGNVKAALWQNDSGFINVTLERIYKDGEDNWKSSSSLGRDDLPKAIRALEQAYDWCFQNQEEE
ncbi:MAG: hypothetical protein AAGA96_08380 [Verrucomicrobiota bacterium]